MKKQPTVRDVFSPSIPEFRCGTKLGLSLRAFAEQGASLVAIVGKTGNPLGYLTEARAFDLVTGGDSDHRVPNGSVEDYAEQLSCVDLKMDLYFVAGLFRQNHSCSALPVMEDNRLVGQVDRLAVFEALSRILFERWPLKQFGPIHTTQTNSRGSRRNLRIPRQREAR